MPAVPMQPVLSHQQAVSAISRDYMKGDEPNLGGYSVFWGFNPYQEMGLPFCYRVEVGDSAPVFENNRQSAAFMFSHLNQWCRK